MTEAQRLAYTEARRAPYYAQQFPYFDSTSSGVSRFEAYFGAFREFTFSTPCPVPGVWKSNRILFRLDFFAREPMMLGTGGRVGPRELAHVLPLTAVPDLTGSHLRLSRPYQVRHLVVDLPAAVPDRLALIRSALSLNVSEMARVLSVERPTIYSWVSGRAHPRSSNLKRLATLETIANTWNAHNQHPVGEWIRRPLSDGRSVIDLLSRAPIPEGRINDLLANIAGSSGARRQQEKPSLRKLLEAHDIRIADDSREIDSLTGRRLTRRED